MPIDVTEPTQTSVMNTPRIEGGLFDNANAVGTVFNPAVQSDYRLNHGAVKTSTMRAKAFDNSVSRSCGAFQTLVFAGDHPDPLLAIRAPPRHSNPRHDASSASAALLNQLHHAPMTFRWGTSASGTMSWTSRTCLTPSAR